ncbi:MAG: hypothetical protein ACHQPH_06330 [Reyranellales bacterium]
MSALRIRVDPYGFSQGELSNVVATISAVTPNDSDAPTAFRPQRLIVPATQDKGTSSFPVDLPMGTYLIEASLPSGEFLRKTVQMRDQDELVILQGTPSPHEWLSWAHLSTGQDRTWRAATDLASPAVGQPLLPPPIPAVFAHFALEGRGIGNPAPPVLYSTAASNMLAPFGQSLSIPAICHVLERRDLLPYAFQLLRPGNSDFRIAEYRAHDMPPGGPPNEYNMPPFVTRYDYMWVVTRWDRVAAQPENIELAALPTGWVDVSTHCWVGADILVNAAPPARSFFASTITVRDSVIGNALSYFTHQRLDEAVDLVSPGVDLASEGQVYKVGEDSHVMMMLYEKVANPIAAAAGAYVLVAQQLDDAKPAWHSWVDNLTRWFVGLPDGPILKGWLHVKRREPQQARDAFLEAHKRGVPLLSAGVRMLADGAALFGREDVAMASIERDLRLLGRHVDGSQPFTVIRVPS